MNDKAACLASLGLWLSIVGCGGGSGGAWREQGVGDPCGTDESCRQGLVCAEDDTCQPAGTGREGDPCALTGDCAPTLYCAPSRTCEPAGEGGDGADCATTADCEPGLVCVIEGLGQRCRPAGGGDLDDVCAQTADCLAGLFCTIPGTSTGECEDPPPSEEPAFPPMLPFWTGAACEEDNGSPRAYFDVPRGEGSELDFFRLPFPNDIRRTATGPDLSDHPSPGTAVPVDVIGRYLRASEEDLDGFATNPAVMFRFSARYSGASLEGAITLHNVTPDSPQYGVRLGVAWMNTYGRISQYICPNWLGVRPHPHGSPLRPGETYAVILSTSIQADDGGSFARPEDLVALLEDEPPSDEALQAAWEAYAPLRAWTADEDGMDRSTILNAAVFTTQHVEQVPSRLRQAVRASGVPAVVEMASCDDDAPSPCDDGTDLRACGERSTLFEELHGRLSIPILQQGEAPYEEPEDGGGIEVDAEGLPTVARTEEVCFALTVPRDVEPPEGGFPLLIYAHGTGGSFRGAITSGLAEAVSDAEVAGTALAAATLSIDLPAHGERRGESTRDPSQLFFNFTNPRAARDNVLQGAADLHSLVYFGEAGAIAEAASPTGGAISFDPSRLVLFAHSQGATHGAIMLPFEPSLAAVVLSGNGGDLTQSLLHKSEPVNIAAILPIALSDPGPEGALLARDFHPALAVFQAYFERADPVNFGRRVHRDPLEEVGLRHLFMTYGLGDSYSPEETMEAYARAAALPVVTPWLTESWTESTLEPPAAGNVVVEELEHTIALRQYEPEEGDDGHFVSTRTTAGREDVTRFLAAALAGVTPQIGQ